MARHAGHGLPLGRGSGRLSHWSGYVKGVVGWPITVDVTAFWRPTLKTAPSKHYHPAAQRARPAVIMGLAGNDWRCRARLSGFTRVMVAKRDYGEICWDRLAKVWTTARLGWSMRA